MRSYFLDTSAIIKRYVDEIGSEWVTEVCQPSTENTIIISQITLVEAVAAFCRKAREQQLSQRISETERDKIIENFRRHAKRQYNMVRVIPTIYTQAGELCRIHRLRAYDAMQLACALKTRTTLAPLGIAPTFVTADINLLNIAQAEGLDIENPNTYSQEQR